MDWSDVTIKYDKTCNTYNEIWGSANPLRRDFNPNLVVKVDTENLLNNKIKKKEGYEYLFRSHYSYFGASLRVKKIIHSGRCTIVLWEDGSKTIVKQSENDDWDEYAAFCAAFCKKIFGSTSAVKRMIDKKTVPYRPTKVEKESEEAKWIRQGYGLIADSKEQADRFKAEIIEQMNRYKYISIARVYEIFGDYSTPASDEFNYGWDDVNDIRYKKKGTEYWFNLPKPKQFKKTVAYRPTNEEKKEDESLANMAGHIIIAESKDQADKWKKEIINRIDNFGRISIAGLYKIVDNKRSPSFNDFDYGWDDVNDIRYVKKSNEYWFNLPKPKSFKETK